MTPDQIDMMNADDLRRELRDKLKALHRIAECTDAPDIDPTGDTEFGLHCGAEDRDCSDRYEGTNFGYTQGCEAALEWAVNEAKHSLSNVRGMARRGKHQI